MEKCPFQSIVPAAGEAEFTIDAELAFLGEAQLGDNLHARLAACRNACAAGRPAPLTAEELVWAGRIAWRNHARCIGRLYWRSLSVRDHRHLESADEIAASLCEHLALAQGDGAVRSVLTVFAPAAHPGGSVPRIWNHQLCGYAGYRLRDGSVLGDPKNLALTERVLALGWHPPATPGRFDLLPWIIAGRDERPRLFALPTGLVQEVRLRHPQFAWFEALGLRWYAVPVITDMRLRAAGTDYPTAPFNGWYMGTEIGARNLADADRYDMLPEIAEKLGLDMRNSRSLWKDRALLELNAAVIHSYQTDGVKLVDHHTAAAEFMKFQECENIAGRAVSARWDWIVPPLSPATTPVFHTPMEHFSTTPDFHAQPPAWV